MKLGYLEKVIAVLWAIILLGGSAWATRVEMFMSDTSRLLQSMASIQTKVDSIDKNMDYLVDQVDRLRDKR